MLPDDPVKCRVELFAHRQRDAEMARQRVLHLGDAVERALLGFGTGSVDAEARISQAQAPALFGPAGDDVVAEIGVRLGEVVERDQVLECLL